MYVQTAMGQCAKCFIKSLVSKKQCSVMQCNDCNAMPCNAMQWVIVDNLDIGLGSEKSPSTYINIRYICIYICYNSYFFLIFFITRALKVKIYFRFENSKGFVNRFEGIKCDCLAFRKVSFLPDTLKINFIF